MSKKIAIIIQMYLEAQYDARVYHQQCWGCNNLSRLILDDSYAEKITYHLKKWFGIKMDRPSYSGKSKGPHCTDLCEGCKDGHCSQ